MDIRSIRGNVAAGLVGGLVAVGLAFAGTHAPSHVTTISPAAGGDPITVTSDPVDPGTVPGMDPTTTQPADPGPTPVADPAPAPAPVTTAPAPPTTQPRPRPPAALAPDAPIDQRVDNLDERVGALEATTTTTTSPPPLAPDPHPAPPSRRPVDG